MPDARSGAPLAPLHQVLPPLGMPGARSGAPLAPLHQVLAPLGMPGARSGAPLAPLHQVLAPLGMPDARPGAPLAPLHQVLPPAAGDAGRAVRRAPGTPAAEFIPSTTALAHPAPRRPGRRPTRPANLWRGDGIRVRMEQPPPTPDQEP